MNDGITETRNPSPTWLSEKTKERKTRITREAETMARMKRLSRAELYSSTNNLHEKNKSWTEIIC